MAAARTEARSFEGFESWADLLNYVGTGQPLYYHATLDLRPVRIQATVQRGGQVRVYPPNSAEADPFMADSGHLSRFKREAEEMYYVGADHVCCVDCLDEARLESDQEGDR